MDQLDVIMESSFVSIYGKKNILDLPEEILERILQSMKLQDQIRMYDVNVMFRRISKGIFSKNLGNYSAVLIDSLNEKDGSIVSYKNEKVDQFITGFRTALRYFRIFKNCISEIYINFEGAKRYEQKILVRLIFENCHSSLKRLTIGYLSTSLSIQCIVFDKIEYIHLNSCLIRGSLARLSILFPNVREIKLTGDCRAGRKEFPCLLKTYPNLEYMRVTPELYNFCFYSVLCDLNSQAFFGYYR